jgi:hydrogenase maturation protease
MLKVIGIGNALRGDDAIGPLIIEELEKVQPGPQAKLIDAGADAFTVLEHLMENDPMLIIDCAKMGLQAGEVKMFKVDEATIGSVAKVVSLHGFGFGDVYKMAKGMGEVAPCKIIGIEPKTIAFDTGLSTEVKKSIPDILNLIKKEAQHYAEENFNN